MPRTLLTLFLPGLVLGIVGLGMAGARGQSTERKVYTTVGEHGERVYTDQRIPGAKQIEVDTTQTYKAPPATATSGSRTSAPSRVDSSFRYQSCAIAAPANDQTFVNPDSIKVSAVSEPAVRPGDIMSILYDGSAVGAPGSSTATVSPVLRGSHTLSVVIRDAAGATLCSSPSITIHARQPTVSTGNRARQNTAQPRARP